MRRVFAVPCLPCHATASCPAPPCRGKNWAGPGPGEPRTPKRRMLPVKRCIVAWFRLPLQKYDQSGMKGEIMLIYRPAPNKIIMNILYFREGHRVIYVLTNCELTRPAPAPSFISS